LNFILQKIEYSKTDSDVIAKLKGTFQERPKKVRRPNPTEDAAESKKAKRKAAKEQAARAVQQQMPRQAAPMHPRKQHIILLKIIRTSFYIIKNLVHITFFLTI
jgi:hypothetical protein